MRKLSLEQELRGNAYPGRGIVIGRSADGQKAVAAYFIMGRSSNSRNRIFAEEGEGIRTDGDQTDTVYEGMKAGQTFEQSLRCREFEPDAPNYTPRISGILRVSDGSFGYGLSILKSSDGNPDACSRFHFAYSDPVAGEGHFIHTYMHDGNPLPSFEGEPKLVGIEGDIDAFTGMVWDSLNEENKVSLFVRYIDIATGEYETKIVNKNS